MNLTTGQVLLLIITVLLAVITSMLGFALRWFVGQIQDSNKIIAAIQVQAGADRQLTAVIAQRLSDHIDFSRTGPTPRRS